LYPCSAATVSSWDAETTAALNGNAVLAFSWFLIATKPLASAVPPLPTTATLIASSLRSSSTSAHGLKLGQRRRPGAKRPRVWSVVRRVVSLRHQGENMMLILSCLSG
jgi:hypothetical protein